MGEVAFHARHARLNEQVGLLSGAEWSVFTGGPVHTWMSWHQLHLQNISATVHDVSAQPPGKAGVCIGVHKYPQVKEIPYICTRLAISCLPLGQQVCGERELSTACLLRSTAQQDRTLVIES